MTSGAERNPWDIGPDDVPDNAAPRAAMRAALRWAVLAPSGHNTQPWRFRLAGDALELRADRTRSLPVADPEDRELTIACGAALFHIRLALHRAGFAPVIEMCPAGEDRDLLARIRVERVEPPAGEEALFGAIPERRTNRKAFAPRPVPANLMDDLRDAAELEGGRAWIVDDESREPVAALVEEGDRIQWADPRFRRELAFWLRSPRGGEGLSSRYLLGLGPMIVRRVDMGRQVGRQDRELTRSAPLLVVLGTPGDDVPEWLQAGQALARMLLRARVDGVDASYMNQPVQVASLRLHLGDAVGRTGYPQVLLRLGYGPAVRPAPRRPVTDVLEVVD